jgi:7-carboxy-7-deazaguanine synthase
VVLRLSELYVSPQGEGQHTGKMTAFVRFAGCNMRCPGWPCDTPHAIFPEIWRKESRKISTHDLGNEIQKTCEETGTRNICYTGGEPFLQNHLDLELLTVVLTSRGFSLECFSNGSFEYPIWARHNIDFMMDWKLAGSGEAETHRLVRRVNALNLKRTDGIKFVAVDWADLEEAEEVYTRLLEHGCNAEFWVGAAWGRIPDAEVIKFVKERKLPWRLNVQVHKYIYEPDARGV